MPKPISRTRWIWAVAWSILALAAPTSSPGADGDGARPAPHVPEFFEMLWIIVTKGADMGPADGWFHPARSRFGWAWLAARDRNSDGAIDADELGGPTDLFARLDRDRDGSIRADDLDWSPGSPYLRSQAAARRRFALMDTDTNGRISRDEWGAFFEGASKGKASLTPEDFGDALYADPPIPPKGSDGKTKPPASSGPSRWTLLTGLFRGELGSRFEGPGIGDPAPDFTLRTHDGAEEVALSKLRGKPVVLIFGSFT